MTRKEIVTELLRRGKLEAVHCDALRNHAAHHVAGSSIHAGGVERHPGNDEHPQVSWAGRRAWYVDEQLDALGGGAASALPLLLDTALKAGSKSLGERHVGAGLDSKQLDEVGGAAFPACGSIGAFGPSLISTERIVAGTARKDAPGVASPFRGEYARALPASADRPDG